MLFIIIGNIISFSAACFMAMASLSKKREKVYIYQCIQCLLFAVASYFFGAYATITTMILCALRNFLIAKDKFSVKVCVVFLVVLGALGLCFNNRGLLGLVPVAATLIYTVGCLVFRNITAIRWNIIVNLAMWVFYEALVFDFVSSIMDSVVLILTLGAIIHDWRKNMRVVEDSAANSEDIDSIANAGSISNQQ